MTKKRKKSAYILFCIDYRPKLIVQYPDMSPKNITRELGKLWSNSSDIKEYYKNGKTENIERPKGGGFPIHYIINLFFVYAFAFLYFNVPNTKIVNQLALPAPFEMLQLLPPLIQPSSYIGLYSIITFTIFSCLIF